MSAMMRALLALLARGGWRGRLSVLIFHRVHAARDPLFPGEPDARDFEQQMEWVRDWFNVLPLADATAGLRAGRLPSGALSITFDDGYADNLRVATPILQRLGLPATFFIATGFVDGGIMWNDQVIEAVRRCENPVLDLGELGLGAWSMATAGDRRAAILELLGRLKYLHPAERAQTVAALVEKAGASLPRDLMLTTAQLRQLADEGMTIGAHTKSHPILARLTPDAAKKEIAEGRDWLEAVLGRRVRLFAYPNGRPGRDYDEAHVRIVRELGFAAGFSTSWGVAAPGCDPFQIPRFTPWDRTPLRYGLRLARNILRRPQLCS